MHSGVINPENQANVFRQISQKRKQGVLEIVAGPTKLNIAFASGRIVDAFCPDESPLLQVARRLADGGYISCDPEEAVQAVAEDNDLGYKALFLALNEASTGEQFVDEEVFRVAVQQAIIDQLYSLHLANGAYYTFRMQMVDFDRDLSPSISVGQLLLDLVSVDADRERYESIVSEHAAFRLTGEDEGNASDSEKRIIDAISQGRGRADQVLKRSLLSQFSFIESLLALHDRGIISVGEEEESTSKAVVHEQAPHQREEEPGESGEISAVDDLVAALEQSIDDSFSESAFAEAFAGNDEDPVEAQAQPAAEALQEEIADETEAEYEGEDDEEYEYDDEDFSPDARVKLNIFNMRMLNASWVPQVVVLLFLAGALIIPVLRWGDAFAAFGDIRFLEKGAVSSSSDR